MSRFPPPPSFQVPHCDNDAAVDPAEEQLFNRNAVHDAVAVVTDQMPSDAVEASSAYGISRKPHVDANGGVISTSLTAVQTEERPDPNGPDGSTAAATPG